MILLFTDFGTTGPYVGQMKAVIAQCAPTVPIIDLMHDAPSFSPMASAYILASLSHYLPEDAIICAVVDPGVGSARPAVLVEADGRRFIGPGNGLFEIVLRNAENRRAVHQLQSDMPGISASFHGRDVFAPVAAKLAMGQSVETTPLIGQMPGGDWPDDLAQIIYVDHYGNAMTGLRAARIGDRPLLAGGRRLPRKRTFSDVPNGMAFWYENSCGLAEIAVNKGSARALIDLDVGSQVCLV